MGLVDGVWRFTGAELAAPLHTLLNKLADSLGNYTTAALTMGSGWSVTAGSVRVRGGIAYAALVVTKTAAFANGEVMFTIAPGGRPVNLFGAGAWQGNGGAPGPCVVTGNPDGTIEVWGQTGGNKQVRLLLTFPAVV